MTEPRMDRDERERLLGRVIDAEAGPEDWRAFRVLASRDPSVWRELAEAQHEHAELSRAMESAVVAAERVEAPAGLAPVELFHRRVRQAATWGGWLAAAAAALAWTLGIPANAPGKLGGSAQLGGIGTVSSPREALQSYLDLGQRNGDVIGQVPELVLLESRPADSGNGYEVVYLRQIIERAVVDELYRFGQDELGRPVPLRESPRPAPSGPF